MFVGESQVVLYIQTKYLIFMCFQLAQYLQQDIGDNSIQKASNKQVYKQNSHVQRQF
jgi:hypothetical protein